MAQARSCTAAGSAARSCARSSARSSARTAATRATARIPERRALAMTIDEALREAAADAARGVVTFRRISRLPRHGARRRGRRGLPPLTLPRPPVALRVELLRGVPTATPLGTPDRQRGRDRAAGVDPGRAPAGRGDAPPRGARPAGRRPAAGPVGADHDAREEVPGTATCLACGSVEPPRARRPLPRERPLPVARAHARSPAYRTRDGAHPALALILLDELGWWLGALARRSAA